MAFHAKYTLRCSCILQVFYLLLAIPAFETVRTKRLIACEDGEIFDFISAYAAAICAIIADEGAVAKEEEVRIGVENCATCVATETVYMPSIAGWEIVSISIT